MPGEEKTRCLSSFPRQPLCRSVACGHWLRAPVYQALDQSHAATPGTKTGKTGICIFLYTVYGICKYQKQIIFKLNYPMNTQHFNIII